MELDSGIRVFAPSYKRGDRLASTQKAYPFVTLVVKESEADAYRASGNRVVTCPDAVQGNLCRVRNWILDKNQDARGVLLLDDDYSHVSRWQNLREKKLNPAAFEEFIEHGFSLAEQWGAFFWGLNCAVDKGVYREYTPFSTTAYIGGPFQAHRPNPIRYDEALPLKEDYDMTLQHANRFRLVLRFNAYMYKVKQNEQAGGCAAYRTIAAEMAQFDLLAKKWGPRVVQRDSGASKQKVRGAGVGAGYDINPIVRVPISGV